MPKDTPKDAHEFFEGRVANALLRHPDKAREVNAIYCFKIGGDDGGVWTVNLASDPPICETGESEEAGCIVEVAHEDFKAMLSDPQAGMQLFFQDRLKISGDLNLATKLQEFFDLASQG